MKLNKNLSYFMALSVLLLWLPIAYFGVTKYTDDLSVWTYAFLLLGLGWDVLDNLLAHEKV